MARWSSIVGKSPDGPQRWVGRRHKVLNRRTPRAVAGAKGKSQALVLVRARKRSARCMATGNICGAAAAAAAARDLAQGVEVPKDGVLGGRVRRHPGQPLEAHTTRGGCAEETQYVRVLFGRRRCFQVSAQRMSSPCARAKVAQRDPHLFSRSRAHSHDTPPPVAQSPLGEQREGVARNVPVASEPVRIFLRAQDQEQSTAHHAHTLRLRITKGKVFARRRTHN